MERMYGVAGALRVVVAFLSLCFAGHVAAQTIPTITTNSAQNITQTTAQLGGTLSTLPSGQTLTEVWVDITPAGGTATRVSLGTNLSGIVATLAPGSAYTYAASAKITLSNGSFRQVNGNSVSFSTISPPAAPSSYPTVKSATRLSFSQQVPSGTKLSCTSDGNCAYWTWTSPDGIDPYQYWVFDSSTNDYSMTIAAYRINGKGGQAPVQTWQFWGGRYDEGVAVNQTNQTVEITAQGGAIISVPLSMIQMPNQSPPNPSRTISVTSAIYGSRISTPSGSSQPCTSSNPITLTSQVQSACSGQTNCNFVVPYPKSGTDPAFGCYKNFRVSYTCQTGGTEFVADIGGVTYEAAGQSVPLTCASLSGITIVSATYGASTTPVYVSKCPAVQAGNRTTQMSTVCNGQPSCAFTVSTAPAQGGDPAFGCSKNFVVNYKCSGSDTVQSQNVPGVANGQSIRVDCP